MTTWTLCSTPGLVAALAAMYLNLDAAALQMRTSHQLIEASVLGEK